MIKQTNFIWNNDVFNKTDSSCLSYLLFSLFVAVISRYFMTTETEI